MKIINLFLRGYLFLFFALTLQCCGMECGDSDSVTATQGSTDLLSAFNLSRPWCPESDLTGFNVSAIYRGGFLYIRGASPFTGRALLQTSGRVVVLGHYPEYVLLAEKMGGDKLNIPTEIWVAMSPFEQWQANVGFLNKYISSGDKIRLATPLLQARPGSSYRKELNYMFICGYTPTVDGCWLVKR